MRTPEEVWSQIEDSLDSATQWSISDDQRAHAADLIRARDAEVRAGAVGDLLGAIAACGYPEVAKMFREATGVARD